MPPHPHPTRHESENAHMRLARNQVLGMRDYVHDQHDYKRKTCARLEQICGIPREATPHILDRMIHLLTAGRLTVNFSGRGFFAQENHSDSYLNCFERSIACRQELKYQAHRDKVENELFDYGGKSASYRTRADMSHTSLNRYGDVDSVRREIAYYGVDSPIWCSMRPRYAALDFAHCTNGGASLGSYGKCFFILRDHMKTAATYTATDSFSGEHDLRTRRAEYGGSIPTPYQASARFHELEKLLYYCHPGLLREICEYGTGVKKRSSERAIRWHLPGHETLNYIEAQLHTDVIFGRDVEAVVLSNSEIMSSEARDNTKRQVDKHANIFARKHGLRLHYVT